MIISNVSQSQPCMIIYYTYNETLEGSSCCKMLESVQTHIIFVLKVGVYLAIFVPLMTQKQFVVTILDSQFHSQPCLTIHYTYDETLKGSSCCQLHELVQTHLILV